MRCSKCNAENPEGKKFCGKCGTTLAGRCPRCGAENPLGDSFCGDCGAALGAPAAAASAKKSNDASVRVAETSAPENIDGERKTVTALFADIKGSMELMEDLDPEEARAIVDPALKLMIEAVQRYGGYVAQSTGDGIFALFGAPIAHEDHPQRALFAAIRMQENLKRYSDTLRERGEPPISIRVGVNLGEVVVRTITTGETHAEYVPIGHSISLASRLQVLASPGSIAISGAVRKLVEGYFTLKMLGPARIKGVSELVEVCEVTGVGPLRTRLQRSVGRGLSKFVGRGPEMQAIERAAELAKAGRGQVVAAVAEAGVGKSRLYYEFKVRNQSDWMVLEAFSVSHGKASAYLPVIDLLYNYFRIALEDDTRARREKVNGKIVTLEPALADTLPYLRGLLGLVEGDDPIAQMDGQVRKRRTLDAIRRILIREAQNQPLMVIFEDLHWIDGETQALLNLITDSIVRSRILLLVNYRPEYRHDWGNQSSYTQLRLEPLGSESAEEMLTALLGDGKDLVPLKRLIIERTEGTPFFVEEIVQGLFEQGALTRNGSVKLAKSANMLQVPITVQAVLAARIDHLPVAEKELVQELAVIGKGFPLRLMEEVVGKSHQDLAPLLSDLQLREFIYEQLVGDDIEYSFKHSLTQEVAYNSVLAERRRITHDRIGRSIETLYNEQLDDHVDELARHYGRGTDLEKALQYLRTAAGQAMRRDAYDESIANLNRALELLRSMPESPSRDREELTLQQALASAVGVARGGGAVELEGILIRARELAERLGDTAKRFQVLAALRWFHSGRNQHAIARELGDLLMAIAKESGDPAMLAYAQLEAARTDAEAGKLSSAVDFTKRFLASSSAQPEADAGGLRFWVKLGLLNLYALGRFKEADEIYTTAVTEAERLSKPLFLAIAHLGATWTDMYSGRYEKGLQRVDLLDALTNQHGFPFIAVQARLSRAEILTRQGHHQQALEVGEPALKEAKKVGLSVDGYRLALISALGKIGRLADAMASVERLLTFAQESGTYHDLSRAHRVRGELLLMFDPPRLEEAEHELRESIAVARREAAKWYELCATTSLARLLRDTDRRDEARAMLANIYNWFTEGFDTADLKDAKALLDELNGNSLS